MLDVLSFEMKPTLDRIGVVIVSYYDLVILCDLCVYKDEKLWVRMPELWINKDTKKSFVSWKNKIISDEFQSQILKKVFDMVGITVEKAVKIRKDFFTRRKEMTEMKNKFTLNEKKL